jgi:hypothetical protein
MNSKLELIKLKVWKVKGHSRAPRSDSKKTLSSNRLVESAEFVESEDEGER